MTINGPAPIILAFYLNAAIDQQVEAHLKEVGKTIEMSDVAYSGELPEGHNGFGLATVGKRGDALVDGKTYAEIKARTLQTVRGTVQADILKEDSSAEYLYFLNPIALKLMGDVQQYYIDHGVRNHYSVSISGYHIAEAGANPITQLAFTLANGFTYVEYYRSRGMDINKFAPICHSSSVTDSTLNIQLLVELPDGFGLLLCETYTVQMSALKNSSITFKPVAAAYTLRKLTSTISELHCKLY